MSTPDKSKDSEHMESHGDESIACWSTIPVFGESEKYEQDEQLKRRSPDEVCVP